MSEEDLNEGEIETFYKMVGLKIAHIRTALGWSQEELSKKLEVVRPSVANWETGRGRLMPHTIEKICKVFNTTPKHLLRGIWW